MNMSVFRLFNEENCNQYLSKCKLFREIDLSYFREFEMFQVFCVVCRCEKCLVIFVILGCNMCYLFWFKMYYGVLMIKQGGIVRLEYICVDYDVVGIFGINIIDINGLFIQFVVYKCNKFYCFQNMDILKVLICVVCVI